MGLADPNSLREPGIPDILVAGLATVTGAGIGGGALPTTSLSTGAGVTVGIETGTGSGSGAGKYANDFRGAIIRTLYYIYLYPFHQLIFLLSV